MLSNREIKDELGRNIVVYPLNTPNIRASSLNLTASKYAWSLNTKESITQNDIIIVIPKHDTALVMTEENLHVSEKISGTYHSKVGLVTKGIGHIGTLLNPMWIGNSLIALHNQTDQDIQISVGDVIVAVCFYRVGKASTFHDTQNTPGRIAELLKNGIKLTEEEIKVLDSDLNGNVSELRKHMTSSVDYKIIKKERTDWKSIAILIVMMVFLGLIFAFRDSIPLRILNMQLYEFILVVGFSGAMLPILSRLFINIIKVDRI